ncbi:hypothetical protein KEM52_000568, partial [Ascosphaera acerosa]
AGVIGLTCALSLQEALPRSSHQICLVAADFPTDALTTDKPNPSYATTQAGAHFRPIPATSPQLQREAALARRAYEKWTRLAAAAPELGVRTCKGVELIDAGAPSLDDYEALEAGYTSHDGFEIIASRRNGVARDDLRRELQLAGVAVAPETAFACQYDTYVIDTEVCATGLLRRFRLGGGRVVRQHLHSVEEASTVADNVQAVVNCSGAGFGDPSTTIIRGQTCLVRNTLPHDSCMTVTRQLADGTWSFVIPRPLGGGTVVGGTKQVGDWSAAADPETRGRLLAAAAGLCPGLLRPDAVAEWDVIKDIVGRRPARAGGLRLEVQKAASASSLGSGQAVVGEPMLQVPVVHAYGLGGRGWELSWGVAEQVTAMVTGVVGLASEAAVRPIPVSRL